MRGGKLSKVSSQAIQLLYGHEPHDRKCKLPVCQNADGDSDGNAKVGATPTRVVFAVDRVAEGPNAARKISQGEGLFRRRRRQ